MTNGVTVPDENGRVKRERKDMNRMKIEAKAMVFKVRMMVVDSEIVTGKNARSLCVFVVEGAVAVR